MEKFNFFKKPIMKREIEPKEEKTVLSRLRDTGMGSKIIKAGTVATFVFGLNNQIKASNDNQDKEKVKTENINNIESNVTNPTPESYDANILVKDLDNAGSVIMKDNEVVVKNLEDIKGAFEESKSEVIKIISSHEYLKNLAKEFDCTMEEAKKHQETRISNINLVKCELLSKEFLLRETNSQAFYSPSLHKIGLPYDVSINKLALLSMHEILHSLTMGDKGISLKAKNILSKELFAPGLELDTGDNKYFSTSTERYVRLKMLEIELANLGIKKVGETMTKDQYHKMLEIYMADITRKIEDRVLSENASQFIDYTTDGDASDNGYDFYKKIFKEIASTDTSKKGETYKHNAWSYEERDNLA